MESYEHEKTIIDIYAPIDVAQLFSETTEKGPLRMHNASSPFEVLISVQRCVCEFEGCQELVVAVWRRNGLLTRHWLLSTDELLSFETLDNFRHAVTLGAMYDPRGETLLMQMQIFNEFNKPYFEIGDPFCSCQSCAEAIGIEALTRKAMLNDMALDLQERDQLLDFAREHGDNNTEEMVRRAFEAGFSFARSVGEYMVKQSIEPSAVRGNLIADGARRGGVAKSASAKKTRDQVLAEIERLVASGKSVSSAAAAVARQGIGSSPEANRKLWNRYKPGT